MKGLCENPTTFLDVHKQPSCFRRTLTFLHGWLAACLASFTLNSPEIDGGRDRRERVGKGRERESKIKSNSMSFAEGPDCV